MDSLFNVGDEVVIKDKYDTGMDWSDYPLGFAIYGMLSAFGGKTYRIAAVGSLNDYNDASFYKDRRMYNGDFYYYRLEGDTKYMWHSSMFKPQEHKDLISIF